WDATNVWLKDHAAALTGKGFVFGGKAAVSDGQVTSAQGAAQSVAAVVNYTVTRGIDGAKLWYADASKKAAVSVTLTSDNVFFVDGNKATIGVFQAALSAGDLVSWSKDSNGVITYKLVSKTADDYNTGIVGVVAGTNASIVEPVTNTSLNTVSFASGTYRVFTIDGSAVSQSIFASSVNVGDTITVTGDGSSASNIQTVALKNGSVSGSVTSWTGVGSNVSLLLDSGAVVSVPVPLSSDTMTVDGKATSTVADVTGALSNGDKVVFSKSGGVASFALSNAAPPVANGQISSVTLLNGRLQTVTYIDAKTNLSVPASNVTLGSSTYATTTNYNSTGPVAQVDTLTLSSSPWKSTAYVELTYGSGPYTYAEVAVGGNQATFMTNLKAALEAKFSGRTATIAQGADDKTYTITWDTSASVSSAATVTGIGGVTYTVDGSLASVTDVQSAITQGDVVAYQAQDVATGTKSSLALTNTGYSGSVNGAAVNTGSTLLGVFSAGTNSTTSLGTAVNYTSSSLLGLSGTPTYTVNGVSKTQAQFEAALNSIAAGGATGTVALSQSGTKLVWALTISVA
ncbi:hypothetical protein ACUN7V_21105, partial [Quadrisphaera oryzae]|uniref:hypothetical protein n=1 Tax=Quadrisphaera TaxID=317661 RepID=UPI0016450119